MENSTKLLISTLCDLTGYELLPSLLFDPLTFEIKSDAKLEELIQSQIDLSASNFILDANLTMPVNWSLIEKSLALNPESDLIWFEKMYGFKPKSAFEIRKFFLLAKSHNLHWFINSKHEPWTDFDLPVLLALIRSSVSL